MDSVVDVWLINSAVLWTPVDVGVPPLDDVSSRSLHCHLSRGRVRTVV
jgi:hypothetical protein